LEHTKILRERKEAYRINLNEMVQSGTERHRKERKQLIGYQKDETVGRWKRLHTYYLFTHSFSHPFIDPYKLKGWYKKKRK